MQLVFKVKHKYIIFSVYNPDANTWRNMGQKTKSNDVSKFSKSTMTKNKEPTRVSDQNISTNVNANITANEK